MSNVNGHQATEEDRKHFCTNAQAGMATPDELQFKSNGRKHVAVNLSTGHQIPCADAYMASGYVAGSTALFPQWKYVLRMGTEEIYISAPPEFASRLKDPNWRINEAAAKQALRQEVDDDYDS